MTQVPGATFLIHPRFTSSDTKTTIDRGTLIRGIVYVERGAIAEQTFPLIRNAKGVVVATDNRKPQSFVKSGSHRASRKLSVPCRENLQISYGWLSVLPSCHYNKR